MLDVRTHRRDTLHHSLVGFLEALQLKRGVDAVALSTADGTLIAGVGEGVDLERMAMVGAESRALGCEWDEKELYSHAFELNDRVLKLTTAGAPVRDDAAVGGLCRILAY